MDEEVDTCKDGFLENDALWVSLAIIVPLVPMVVGLLGCYFIKSRIFDPIRMFCFSFTVYTSLVINVWMIPYLGCPGVSMSSYPAIIKAAVQVGWVIVPAGLTLSGCEFAWYCTKNKVFSRIRFSEGQGVNWDQSNGFQIVRGYFTSDKDDFPLDIETKHTAKCFGDAHDSSSRTQEMPLYSDISEFYYDRMEDQSDRLPHFDSLKKWQGVHIKFSQEVLAGDQFTLNQMIKWKEDHKKSFAKYIADNYDVLKMKNGGMPFNHSTFDESIKITNLPQNVAIHDLCVRPWYTTPICWVIAFCGVWCILWLPVMLGVWRVKKFNIVLRKRLFVNQ